MRLKLLLLLVVFVLISSFAFSEVPHQISYQGILKDSTGAPVDDGIYAIKFRIYDDSTAGTILWETAGFVPVQTKDGLFQHTLGSTNPLPDSITRFPYQWVGLSINLGSELQPRTRLSSVPFSLSTQYADTAKISLDRTINAGDLIMGTLDTARFSAYQDLTSENKIGSAPDQVAAGDHTHPGVSGAIMRIEDTTVTHVLVSTNDDTLLRRFIIPWNLIRNFVRISYAIKLDDCGVNLNIKAKINGTQVSGFNMGCNTSQAMILSCNKLNGDTWVGGNGLFTVSPNTDLIIEIYGQCGYSATVSVWIGDFVVEYDVD